MAKRTSKSRNAIIIVVILIAVLVGVAGFIAYTIYKARQETIDEPTETLSSCCSCNYQLESEDGSFIAVYNTEGILENNSCTPFESITAGTELNSCANFSNDYGEWEGDMRDLGSCISNNTIGAVASPPAPSDQDPNVSLVSGFVSFESDTSNTGYDAIKIEFKYPDDAEAPEPITATFDDNGNLEEEIEGFTLEQEQITLPGDQAATLFIAQYDTTWDMVMDLETPGTYRVLFSAQYKGEDNWTEVVPESTLEFTLEEERERQSFCNDLDISSQGNISPLNVTLNVDASIASDNAEPVYQWKLDLNCDGQIDTEAQGENAEQFITTGSGLDEQQITRTFSIPETEQSGTCQASVDVYLSQEDLESENPIPVRSEGACEGQIELAQASPDCGNGTCDPQETCDTNGNVDCLEGTKGSPLPSGQTCREDCTYCGDGVLNANETCDPNIPEGQPGYNENCQDDCTAQEPEPEEPEEPTEQGGITASTSIDQECVELVSPNNALDITIQAVNSSEGPKTVRAISDTLPRGISYVAGSTEISATPADDPIIESSGESQLLTWDNAGNGWIVPPGGTVTIKFQAVAGGNTEMGEKTNDITITLADQNPVPASGSFIVAQNCSQPDTGIFDNNVVIILFGTALLIIAGAAYYTGFGSQQTALFMDFAGKNLNTATNKIKNVKDDIILFISQPQKYMEKRIEKSALKDINKHTNGKNKNDSQKDRG